MGEEMLLDIKPLNSTGFVVESLEVVLVEKTWWLRRLGSKERRTSEETSFMWIENHNGFVEKKRN